MAVAIVMTVTGTGTISVIGIDMVIGIVMTGATATTITITTTVTNPSLTWWEPRTSRIAKHNEGSALRFDARFARASTIRK